MGVLKNVCFLMVHCVLCVTMHAYQVSVKNETMREVQARFTMVALIKDRKTSDWMVLKPGTSADYDTGARLVKGIEVKLSGSDAQGAYKDLTLLSESADPGMAIRAHYRIFSTVTSDKNGGSKEVFHLLRMPNIALSRPGGIVSDSGVVSFNKQTKQGCRDEGASEWTYDQFHYVTAHNAFTSAKYGYNIDPQQDLTLSEQLKCGIRGFMLDTYVHDGKVVVQHSADFDKFLKLGKPPTLLETRMNEIADFLRKNKDVIVTIFYEDYVGKEVHLLDKVLEKYSEVILKPSDWNPFDKKKQK